MAGPVCINCYVKSCGKSPEDTSVSLAVRRNEKCGLCEKSAVYLWRLPELMSQPQLPARCYPCWVAWSCDNAMPVPEHLVTVEYRKCDRCRQDAYLYTERGELKSQTDAPKVAPVDSPIFNRAREANDLIDYALKRLDTMIVNFSAVFGSHPSSPASHLQTIHYKLTDALSQIHTILSQQKP